MLKLNLTLLLVSLLLLPAAPSLATMVRGEFSGVFTESELNQPGSGVPIPEIGIGDPFTGFFEYDTDAFEFEPDPGFWDFGATLSWSTATMTSEMTRLSAIVGEDQFRIFLIRETDNPDDSINGDPPFYINYSISLNYSEPVFFDLPALPTASPPISKLTESHLLLIGYTNNDTRDFRARGQIDYVSFAIIPEPTVACLLALGLAGLTLRRTGSINR